VALLLPVPVAAATPLVLSRQQQQQRRKPPTAKVATHIEESSRRPNSALKRLESLDQQVAAIFDPASTQRWRE
jgi:hypothetical protein